MKSYLSYQNIWFRNIVFASIFFTLLLTQTLFSPEIPGMPHPSTFELVGYFIFMYSIMFVNNHFSVRLFLFKRKYKQYIISTLSLIFIFVCFGRISNINSPIDMPVCIEIPQYLVMFLIATGIYFLHTWVLNNIIKTKIDLLNREAEITFLKQQLSPHFLFNAINNLYGTALAEPEIITDKILELADLLRYQVESTTMSQVCVKEEMEFVENYLNYTNYKSNNLKMSNEVIGAIKPFKIPPLLFLPLLENAVKYSSETDEAIINILWRFEKNTLEFNIQNNYLSENSMINGTKVGIENLKKRLQLLDFRHELIIDTSQTNQYKIYLKLWGLVTNV
jgi:two-component system, LytTR family, sensor kinase